ncbi:MAG TPA: ATP-binding protein [Acetobacteraceae bacterium]|nr:ATP-binding protein [Acetobacteraceae bacterium]
MLDVTANIDQSRPASSAEEPAQPGLPGAVATAPPIDRAEIVAPSVTKRLVMLLTVVTIPLLAFSALLILLHAREEQRQFEQQIRATTIATSLAIDGEILREQAILTTLRSVQSMRTHDWAEFYRIAKAAVADEPGARITLNDPTGRMVISTMVPYGAALPFTNNAAPIRRVVAVGKPYVSDLFVGAVSHERILAVYAPVVQDGSVAYVLSIAFPTDAVSRIVHEQELPTAGFGVVIDRGGTIIARSIGENAYVGQRGAPGMVEPTRKATAGYFEARTLDGLYVEGEFVKSPLSEWTVSLGMQRSALEAPLRRALWMFGGGGLAIFAAAMTFGWYQGRNFVRMLARLHRMAESLGRGEELAPTTFGVREAQYIANGMVAASQSLNRHAAEREAIMATLDASNQRLELANKDLESFSYSVSHDLRTPLRAIDGFSRILAEDYASSLDQEGLRLLKLVCDNTRKLGRLIDDILAFSRTGRQDIEPVDVDMTALVREVIDELRPALEQRTVAFNVEALPPAHTDRAMMQRVLTNLLDNAIKYTAPKPAATIGVAGQVAGNEIIYCVTDNGVGFDEKYVGKLFGVFQRLHAPGEFQGTGIGLAIVKRIMTRQGGRVWAEGALGEGAAFYFTIPNAVSAASPPTELDAVAPAASANNEASHAGLCHSG